jgi:predicted O-methyltransferase YrrM
MKPGPSKGRTPLRWKHLANLPRDWIRKVRGAAREQFFRVSANRDGNLKLPPALILDAVWRASRGGRMKLLRRLIPYLSPPATGSSAGTCAIDSLAEFEAAYTRLAAILGHAGKTPPPGEIEFLRTMVNRPLHYSGVIAPSDYFFLTAFVSILAPPRVVEIGTLTGFSAAIIAAALRRQSGQDSPRWVDTIDLLPKCFIDETRPTGFEIAESFPELASMIRLHIPHDSTVIRELAEPDELEIVFIDANHQHPLPLLDLLRFAPYIRPGGWVVLHDIQLGTMGRKANVADPTLRWGAAEGAELLFESWPFRKICGGNIGAIQLPNEKSALVAFALRLMSVPYEIKGGSAQAADHALHRSFDALI